MTSGWDGGNPPPKLISGLQGRVKFPIGGIVRERVSAGTGEIPVPTVTVWMEEDSAGVFPRFDEL